MFNEVECLCRRAKLRGANLTRRMQADARSLTAVVKLAVANTLNVFCICRAKAWDSKRKYNIC